jgi:hypothetical protein
VIEPPAQPMSDRKPVTLRAPSSIALFVAVVVVSMVLVGDAILRGRWDVAVASVPAVGLGLWAASVLFLTPGVRLSERGVTVMNVLRTTVVPWADVEEITTRFQVVVTTRDGLRIRCWGAPTSARTRVVPSDPGGSGSRGGSAASATQLAVGTYWERYRESQQGETGVTRRWNLLAIIVGAVFFLTVAVQIALFATARG